MPDYSAGRTSQVQQLNPQYEKYDCPDHGIRARHAGFAQRDKDIPAFGTVDKADLLLKECDFDKDAKRLYFLMLQKPTWTPLAP